MGNSDESYAFFAMLDRMQYINRWGLMRNNRTENIKEHSFDVAVIAQALASIHNHFIEMNDIGIKDDMKVVVDPLKVLAYAVYHDCTEIITGDLPTPIKYRNDVITKAYKEVESEAADTLTGLLPEFMRKNYKELLSPCLNSEELVMTKKLVKAADRISAYIKCLEEESSGNHEFSNAKETIKASIDRIGLPEVDYFMDKFVPSYGMTLDQISGQ